MASKTINPTRMELTRLKGRLRTAVRGHRLLKDKRDELMRQFFLIVRENKALRAKVEAGIEEANRAMTVASSVMSPEMLQQALLYPKQSATLDMTFKNIMSVSVPIYEFHTKSEDAASIYPYGFAQTSGELDDALGALASVFQDMLELAQAEKKTQLLASEIEKTRRRVNALEYILMPQYQEVIRTIRNLRAEMNVAAGKRTHLMLLPADGWAETLAHAGQYFQRLAGASETAIIESSAAVTEKTVSAVTKACTLYIPLGDLVDFEKEIARLSKELDNLHKEIARAEGKLNNPGFVSKAPAALGEQEKGKLALNQQKAEQVEKRIAELKESM